MGLPGSAVAAAPMLGEDPISAVLGKKRCLNPAFHCELMKQNPFEIEPWYLVKRSLSNGESGFARSVPGQGSLHWELLSNANTARTLAHGCIHQ